MTSPNRAKFKRQRPIGRSCAASRVTSHMHDYTGNAGSPVSLRNPDPARNNASDSHAKNFVSQSKFFSVVVDRRPHGQREGGRGKRWAEPSEKTRGPCTHTQGVVFSRMCSKAINFSVEVIYIFPAECSKSFFVFSKLTNKYEARTVCTYFY